MADVIPLRPKAPNNSDVSGTPMKQIGVTTGGTPIVEGPPVQAPLVQGHLSPTPLNANEYVWTCSICACQCFHLLSSGETACVRCGHRSDDAVDDASSAWRSHLPDLPLNLADIPPLDASNSIIDQKPTSMILKSFEKGISTEDPVVLLMIRREGGMRMWCEGVYTDEQEAWVKSRLETASTYFLTRYAPEPEPDAPEGET